MAYEYSDPKRWRNDVDNADAQPDVEVFNSDDHLHTYLLGSSDLLSETKWFDSPGFYYAFGFPGCTWDSDPVGPFDSYQDALKAAREVE